MQDHYLKSYSLYKWILLVMQLLIWVNMNRFSIPILNREAWLSVSFVFHFPGIFKKSHYTFSSVHVPSCQLSFVIITTKIVHLTLGKVDGSSEFWGLPSLPLLLLEPVGEIATLLSEVTWQNRPLSWWLETKKKFLKKVKG